MDLQQIKTFIDAMASSDLAEMEVSQEGWTLRLVRRAVAGAPSVPARAAGFQEAAAGRTLPIPAPEAAPRNDEVRAPLYGVVHLQPSPGEPPFVAEGSHVKAGQTLCVIEAMKVFNEVRAERDGTVESLLVKSGQEVEAGQTLLRFA
ncbi:MAG: acetyl-CoA carboxylase biotin carboxyl carrier protein [Ramlibacter sp.]